MVREGTPESRLKGCVQIQRQGQEGGWDNHTRLRRGKEGSTFLSHRLTSFQDKTDPLIETESDLLLLDKK